MRHQQDFSKSSCSCYCPPPLSCSLLSSPFTFSIYFFGCLPLLLVPSTWPNSATAGCLGLLFSILVTCTNHVSLLFLILSMNVISCPRSPHSRGVHPPWGNDAFTPSFGFSPISEKIFRLDGKFSRFHLFPQKFRFSSTKISDDLFSHRLQIWNFAIPYFRFFSTFPPCFVKILISHYFCKFPLWFRKMYVFCILYLFFVSPLLWPWCIYASHNAGTGRPCLVPCLVSSGPTQ